MRLLELGIRPRDIITRESIENAIAVTASMGGSTNAVLHLLAIAYEANVPFDIDDFDRVSSRTPFIADLKPGGKYVMADLDRVGWGGPGDEAPSGGGTAPRRHYNGHWQDS